MKRTLILVALTLATQACTSGEAGEAPTRATAEVTRGNLRITAEATGTIEPVRTVEVKSKASGEILRLHVDVGDQVEPGALLAEIDPRDVRTDYNQAEADLQVAQARAEISQAQLERSRELHDAGVITQQELESANLDFANAQATLTRARSTMALAELRLQDVTIRAPLAGTILTKNVEEGGVIQSASGNVSGGTALFLMAQLDEMQVRTLIDETDMGKIEAGMPTTVTVDAFPDRTFRGVVEKIEPQAVVQQNVTMFPVIVTLDNRGGLLKPGMNAEVEILIDQAMDVMLVPNQTVVTVQDVIPAAMALGLDTENMDMAQFRGARPGAGAGGAASRGAGARVEGSPARGGGDGVGAGGAPQERAARGPGAGAGAGAGAGVAGGRGAGMAALAGMSEEDRARLAELRRQVQAGEIPQDSLRAVMASMARGGGGGPLSGNGNEIETRPAFVFVMENGAPTPKMVQIGLNDWDFTQVVSGLEGSEQLAVIGAAQLMQQQQEFMNRMRGRGGGPFGR